MTLSLASRRPAVPAAAPPDRLWLALALAVVIAAALSWRLGQDVWTTGAFGDTDDATRLVQVRDWMAGQGWYDLQLKRLGLPGAAPMHWTRVVDAPVALLIEAFGLALDVDHAERAARIAFPALVLLGVFAAGARLASELIGAASMLPATLLLSLAGLSILQFQPGRIDHHAPQALVLLLAILFLLRAAGGGGARWAIACAGCLSLSLAISPENLPAFAAIGAGFVGLWIAQGQAHRRALVGFGAGLVGVTPLTFALTSPPAHWFATICDAQSVAHVTLTLCSGALCLILAAAGGALASRRARCGAVVAGGLVLIAIVARFFPQCAGDPYVGIDPVVRRDWLDKVREAQSIGAAWAQGPRAAVLASFVPAGLGLAGMVLAIWRTDGVRRVKWALLLAVAASTCAVAAARIGYGQTMLAMTCFGSAYLLSLLPPRWRAWRLPAAVAMSWVGLALLLPGDSADAAKAADRGCSRPAAARGLTGLAPGWLLAPIGEGAYLLANSPHRIVAAPYHRNNAGNRLEVDVFSLPADDAVALLRRAGVDYLAVCGEQRRAAPLLAALRAGPVEGVTKLDAPGDYDVWRVAR